MYDKKKSGQSELCNVCHYTFVQICKVVLMETSEKYPLKKKIGVNWVFSQAVPSVLSALDVSHGDIVHGPLCMAW